MFYFARYALGLRQAIEVCSIRFPHSEIPGSQVATHLPEAYRCYAASFIAFSSLGIHHSPLFILSCDRNANHPNADFTLVEAERRNQCLRSRGNQGQRHWAAENRQRGKRLDRQASADKKNCYEARARGSTGVFRRHPGEPARLARKLTA